MDDIRQVMTIAHMIPRVRWINKKWRRHFENFLFLIMVVIF